MRWLTWRYRGKLTWFYARQWFTKSLGLAGIAIGYAMEHQADWVQFLAENRRGVVLKFFGITVFLLGVYNHLFPLQRPQAPP